MVCAAGDANGNGHPPRPRCGAIGPKRMYIFVPQPDISVSELADALEILMFGMAGMLQAVPQDMVDHLYDGLSDGSKRHWQTRDMSEIAIAKRHGGLHLPPGVN